LAIHNIQESNALLLYRVGPVLVCSPTMPVEVVMIPPKITVPPGANVAEPGVFKSMHGMVRLVDLRVRFGVDKSDFSDPGKVVVVEVEGGHAGFWVDEIEDVISFPESGWKQVPAYIPRNVFSRTLLHKENIRLYADFEQLDKFKSTGYLRKHIEMIKATENRSVDKSPLEVTDKNVFDGSKKTNKENKNNGDELKTENKVSTDSRVEQNKNVSYEEKPSSLVIKSRQVNEVKKKATIKTSQAREVIERQARVRDEVKRHEVANVRTVKREINLPRAAEGDAEVVLKKSRMKPEKEMSKQLTNNHISKNRREESKDGGFIWLVGVSVVFIGALFAFFNSSDFNKDDKYTIVNPSQTEQLNDVDEQVGLISEGLNDEIEKTEEFDVVKEIKVDDKIESEAEIKTEVEEQAEQLIETQVEQQVETQSDPSVESQRMLQVETPDELQTQTKSEIKEDSKEEGDVRITKNERGVLIEINDFDEASENELKEISHQADDEKASDEFAGPREQEINRAAKPDSYTVKAEILLEKATASKDSGLTEEKHGTENIKVLNESKTEISLNTKEKAMQNKQTKVSRKKYIHVVVKGDTLWYIAKKYVQNPWRYPELARLSNIKNPDLIYPGDQVTIIINFRRKN